MFSPFQTLNTINHPHEKEEPLNWSEYFCSDSEDTSQHPDQEYQSIKDKSDNIEEEEDEEEANQSNASQNGETLSSESGLSDKEKEN